MAKRLGSDKMVALNYYIGASLFAFIPGIVIIIILDRVLTSTWVFVLLEVLLFTLVTYFAFRWSGKVTGRGFVVRNISSIKNWTIGYLSFFNLTFLLFSLMSLGYITVGFVSSILNVIASGVIIYTFTPKFITLTPPDEVEQIKQELLDNPKAQTGIIKQVLKTTLLVVGGIVLLLFAPLILYLVLTENAHLQSNLALFIVALWEIAIILLAIKFIFKKKKAELK